MPLPFLKLVPVKAEKVSAGLASQRLNGTNLNWLIHPRTRQPNKVDEHLSHAPQGAWSAFLFNHGS